MDIPWGQILAVGIPALVSIASAGFAVRSARRAQTAEHEAARLRALEDRVAVKKYETYLPLLQTLGDTLTPTRSKAALVRMEDVVADFQTFVTAWGSDAVVEAFYRYRVGANASPPPLIIMRLMSDFLLEVRRDVALPDTKLTGMHMIGMRISDLRDHPEFEHALTIPLDQLFREQNWTPPFNLAEADGKQRRPPSVPPG